MDVFNKAVEWVAGAVQTNSPKPQAAQSKASLKPSAGAQNTRQRGATLPQHSQPLTGITKRDAEMRDRAEQEKHRLLVRAAQGTDILEEMNMPRESEGPNQIQEIQDNLATLAEAMMRLEKKLDVLLQRGR